MLEAIKNWLDVASTHDLVLLVLMFGIIVVLAGTLMLVRHRLRIVRRAYESQPPVYLPHTLLAHIDWDLALRVTEWDAAAEQMFGYTRAEAMGRHVSELIAPPRWRERLDRIYHNRLERHRTFRHTNHARNKAGEQLLCEWYETTREDAEGNALGWSSVAIDITRFDERLRKMGLAKEAAEANLRESEERLGFYLETIGGDSWDYDFASGALSLSDSWIERFGYQHMPGNRSLDFWVSLVPVEDLARLIGARDRFLEGADESFHEEFRIRTLDDQERWVRVQGKLIERDAQDRPRRLVGIITDVTEHRRSQDEHDQLKHQLFQAQKMETMGQLTGGIAHDFNNMLASIIGYTQLVLDRGREQLDEKLKDYLHEVAHAGQQAQKLVNTMLSFGRDASTENEPASLGYLVNDSVKLLKPSLPSSIDLKIDIPERLPSVQTNPVNLTQLLMNLSLNAKDAMNGMGELRISVAESSIADRSCDSCRKRINGEYVELIVADNGAGISRQLIFHIFEPFFTTKEVGKGTGMGLSMVHRIMHEIGGHIIVDSTPGVGTSFRLLFPPYGPYKSSSAEEEGREPAARGSEARGHIMVVDDDTSVAQYLAEVLKRDGHEVTVKFDSIEALDAFREDPYEFDLVLTDQTMPKLTGDLLMKAILSVRSDLPVVICTGYSEQMNEETARNLGARGYLRKPIDLKELARLIDESLKSYSAFSL